MKIRLRPLSMAIVAVILLFGGIAASDVLGYWITKSTKVPATYTSGEFAGSYNPADIRGSYSFGDINRNFEVPLEHLARAFGLKEGENAEEFQCKELETIYEEAAQKGYEVGTDSVRVFVALYKGLPMELPEDTYLPRSAAQILKENAVLTPEQVEYLNTHAIDVEKLGAVSVGESVEAVEHNEDGSETLVKGKTTFREIMDWGVSKEEIEQVIGTGMPNATFTVRDFCVQQGMEFAPIKEALQKVIDNK